MAEQRYRFSYANFSKKYAMRLCVRIKLAYWAINIRMEEKKSRLWVACDDIKESCCANNRKKVA